MSRLLARSAACLLFTVLLVCLSTATQPQITGAQPANASPAESPAALTALATGIYQAGLLADGRLLCVDFDGLFSTVDLYSGTSAPWAPDWYAKRDGFEDLGGGGFNWKLAVSPDGAHVALARSVGINHPDPEGDYMDTAVAILLCGPDGSAARCVGLAEVTDGGPPLDFTQDSSRLVGPWFYPCLADAAGFQAYVASGYAANDALRFNYVDTATGAGRYQAELADFEFYTKAPQSDYFAYEELDEPGLSIGSFMGGVFSHYIPPENHGWTYYEWVAPDVMLVILDDASQVLISPGFAWPLVRGDTFPTPRPSWHLYAYLSDGTCLFSDDRGRSVKHGQVSWKWYNRGIVWQVPLRNMARFAEPLGDDGWPARINKWIPLPDSSGVVVITPDEGEVFLVKLGR